MGIRWLECLAKMLRFLAILGGFLLASSAPVWAQQTPPQQPVPPPDTKASRERHRIQEKEPPPPEGPWGDEDFGFTWRNPVFRGVFADYEATWANSMNMNVPRGIQGETDGISASVVETLRWKEESFRTIGGRLLVDLDMLRLSATYFNGTFDARSTFTVVDTLNGTTVSDADIHGKAYGFHFNAYWPMLRYRDFSLDASIGPATSVGWLHEEVTSINLTPPIPVQDAKDILTGTIGARASLRYYVDRYSLEAEAEYDFMTGGARGWTRTLTAGIGIHF
jgi:hypothetical protein